MKIFYQDYHSVNIQPFGILDSQEVSREPPFQLIETVLKSSLEISLEDDVRILSREPSEDVDKSPGGAAGMLLPEIHQLLVGHHAHHPL